VNKAARKEHNQRIAAQLKRDGIERTTGRCPICGKLYYADMLKAGYAAHRCK
jgi:phage/plasmid primase-like uncharacterized protein